jgi:hypothetical protein
MSDGEDVPGWAVDLMRAFGRVDARLARLEGGLVLAGFLVGILVTLIAAHIIAFAPAP